MAALRLAHPGASVEVWAQDEHRIGLHPIRRRVWQLADMPPVAPVCPRYEWCYVVGWVRPETGDNYWLLVPRIGTDVYRQALAIFAQAQGAGAAKQIVLVVDQAGWHRSGDLVIPDGLHLVFLPVYTYKRRVRGILDRFPWINVVQADTVLAGPLVKPGTGQFWTIV